MRDRRGDADGAAGASGSDHQDLSTAFMIGDCGPLDYDPVRLSCPVRTSWKGGLAHGMGLVDAQDYVWRSLITTIAGTLRASGVETYPEGMP